VTAPVRAVLGKRRRGRGACKQNGDNDLTHVSDFLVFPDSAGAPRRLSGGLTVSEAYIHPCKSVRDGSGAAAVARAIALRIRG
jgi:hypothetical protein